jgi:hypothetical protein
VGAAIIKKQQQALGGTTQLQAAASLLAVAKERLERSEADLASVNAAADDERRTSAALSRQLDALRLVLVDRAADDEARGKAADARERELSGQLAEARALAADQAARAASAEGRLAQLAARLEAARRELSVLTGGSGVIAAALTGAGCCGDVRTAPDAAGSDVGDGRQAVAAARELVLGIRRAELAAEERAEAFAAILVEREEELSYYRRHCVALEAQVRSCHVDT